MNWFRVQLRDDAKEERQELKETIQGTWTQV
jgi:hypothetical protein